MENFMKAIMYWIEKIEIMHKLGDNIKSDLIV